MGVDLEVKVRLPNRNVGANSLLFGSGAALRRGRLALKIEKSMQRGCS